MKNDDVQVNFAADSCIPACSNIVSFQPSVTAMSLILILLRCAYAGRFCGSVIVVYNNVRTRKGLLGTYLDIWIISVEFSSFLALPNPDSRAKCPGKGLNELQRLVFFQEGSSWKSYYLPMVQKNPNKTRLPQLIENRHQS